MPERDQQHPLVVRLIFWACAVSLLAPVVLVMQFVASATKGG